jgi:hypothetical protein
MSTPPPQVTVTPGGIDCALTEAVSPEMVIYLGDHYKFTLTVFMCEQHHHDSL